MLRLKNIFEDHLAQPGPPVQTGSAREHCTELVLILKAIFVLEIFDCCRILHFFLREREKKKKVFWREVLADFVVWYLSSLNKNGFLLFSAAFYLRKNWSYFLAWKSFMDLTKFSWTIITNSPLTNMLCKWSVSWLQPYAFSFKIVIFQAPEKLKGSCFYSLSAWDLGYVKKV